MERLVFTRALPASEERRSLVIQEGSEEMLLLAVCIEHDDLSCNRMFRRGADLIAPLVFPCPTYVQGLPSLYAIRIVTTIKIPDLGLR